MYNNQDIDNVLEEILNTELQVKTEKETLKIYYKLLIECINAFFQGKTYEVFKNGEKVTRKYQVDLISIMSLINIQDKMLKNGLDLMYSFYNLDDGTFKKFVHQYGQYVEKTNIFKFNVFREENISLSKEINNDAQRKIVFFLQNS